MVDAVQKVTIKEDIKAGMNWDLVSKRFIERTRTVANRSADALEQLREIRLKDFRYSWRLYKMAIDRVIAHASLDDNLVLDAFLKGIGDARSGRGVVKRIVKRQAELESSGERMTYARAADLALEEEVLERTARLYTGMRLQEEYCGMTGERNEYDVRHEGKGKHSYDVYCGENMGNM
eukprot:Rmarinus@m.24333